MHRALRIEEILRIILSYCYTGRLLVMARTCKAFKDLALDLIWAKLHDLTPLVRCLPRELWVNRPGSDGHPRYSFTKCLGPTEWVIILGYTRRVRALSNLRGSSALTVDCIRALSNPLLSTSPIFPNLRELYLEAPSPTIAPFLRHLISPAVTTLRLSDTDALEPIIGAFGPGCPLVTDFSSYSSKNTVSNLICHWKNLRSVICIRLDVNALSHLSRLHNLHHMSFWVYQESLVANYAARSLPPFTFSALRDLHLDSLFLHHVWILLRHFRAPIIRDIAIRLFAHPTLPDFMSFSMALQDSCTGRSLNSIRICVTYDNEELLRESKANSQLYYITFNHLLPLTIFTNLKTLALDLPCGIDINESDFLTLASSWPHLEHFEMGQDYDSTPSSAITPSGFIQLLKSCRSLQTLYFMLDTRGYTEVPQGDPWHGRRMPGGSFIGLLHSHIEEASIPALAVFFHVAPHADFNMVSSWNDEYFLGTKRPRALCDVYHQRWVKVRDQAYELWEERRGLRHALETRSGSSLEIVDPRASPLSIYDDSE